MRRSGPCGRNPAKGCEALRCRLGARSTPSGTPTPQDWRTVSCTCQLDFTRGLAESRKAAGPQAGSDVGALRGEPGYAESERTTMLSDLHGSSLRRLVSSAFKTLKRKLFSCECADVIGGDMPQGNGPHLANGSDAMPILSSSLPAGSPRSAGGNGRGWSAGLDKDKRPDRTMSQHDCHPGLALRHALSGEAMERADVGSLRASPPRVFCKCPRHGSGLPVQKCFPVTGASGNPLKPDLQAWRPLKRAIP